MDNKKIMALAIEKAFAKLSAMPSHELKTLVENNRRSELAGLLGGKAFSNRLEAEQALAPSIGEYDVDILINLPESNPIRTSSSQEFYKHISKRIASYQNANIKIDWDSLPVLVPESITNECLPAEMAYPWSIAA